MNFDNIIVNIETKKLLEKSDYKGVDLPACFEDVFTKDGYEIKFYRFLNKENKTTSMSSLIIKRGTQNFSYMSFPKNSTIDSVLEDVEKEITQLKEREDK